MAVPSYSRAEVAPELIPLQVETAATVAEAGGENGRGGDMLLRMEGKGGKSQEQGGQTRILIRVRDFIIVKSPVLLLWCGVCLS